MPRGKGADRPWSGVSIDQIIDREFGLNHEIRSGHAAYARMMDDFIDDGDEVAMVEAVLDSASFAYRKAGQPDAELYTFSDGSANFLFDMKRERVVLVWGRSRKTDPNSRDEAYHRGYPTAGKNMDKGHAWSHAQGGREGGPNYFRQARRLNQARSINGKLWRAIESYLAANENLFAFIRLIYASGSSGDKPAEVEYGVLSGTGQFRAVIFPNS